jgi:hypothetical protein
MNHGLRYSFILATALCACQQANTLPSAEAPIAAPLGLVGDWRVMAIDGVTVEGPGVLALKADRDRIWWEPLCAGIKRDYRIDGGSIRFRPVPLPPGSAPNIPQPVCAIGPPPRLDSVFVALDSVRTVRNLPSGGLLFEGAGYMLSLARAKAP